MMDTNQLKKNQYLDTINHAPYGAIVMISLLVVGLFTVVILLGLF
ncbi:MAG: hypothetical protein ACFCU8_20405 [Thermosynechococcaceae cyanobacterium]